jgi:hypothetical protein
MSKTLLAGMLALGVGACSPANAKPEVGSAATTTTTARPVSNVPSLPAQLTLVSGRQVEATIQDSISSRHNTAGETLNATVSADVKDAYGRVAIPAGSAVALRINLLEAATNKSQADGKIALEVTSVTVRGQGYSVNAPVASIPHQLVGRGVTAGEVEKAGGGAVIGAVIGRVIGGNATGTVIGGAVGAAAGTAAAVHWASRDVVVTPGTSFVFSLTHSLIVAAR